MAGLIWVSVAQFLNLAASLPEYKKNIQEKVAILRSDPDRQSRQSEAHDR